MTEKSYVWEGIVTGDSTLAPYYAEAFNRYAHLHLGAGDTGIYVLPGYLNDLEPVYSTDSPYSLTVLPGAALYNNFLYVQDTNESLVFDSVSAGFYRIDTVVLQADYAAQTVRPIVKPGTAQASISTALTTLAAFTQTANVLWEEALFYVLLDGNAVYNYLSDQRHFALSFESYIKRTSLVNTEFLSFAPALVTQGPEGWDSSDGTALSDTTLPGTQARGRAVALTTSQGIKQTVPVSTGTNKTFSITCLNPSITPLVIRMRGILLTGGYTDWFTGFGVYYFDNLTCLTHTFTEEITDVEVEIINPFVTTAAVGQVQLVEAYHPGNNRLITDWILMFKDNETDAAWSATAKSTGNTTIDLTASFGNNIKSGTKAAVVRLEARDSGSAAGSAYLQASSLKLEGGTMLIGVPNDYWRSLTTLVPVSYAVFNTSSGVPQFVLNVTATGAGTLDATAEVVGIIT